jgi:hypothetical protein
MGESYLDIEVLIDFHRFAEYEDELHDTCEFPHVSYFLNERDLSRGLGCFHLGVRALEVSRTHREGRGGPRRHPLMDSLGMGQPFVISRCR